MSENTIKKVVVLGGGTAGWMAASMLASRNGIPGLEITIVESSEIGIVGVGEASIPPIKKFNSLLGISEEDFFNKTDGTYKLSIKFQDWGKTDHYYYHPFGPIGVPIDGTPFISTWGRMQEKQASPDDFIPYSLASLMCESDVFQHPSPDKSSPLSGYTYAFHFDTTLYGKLLRELALSNGVERVEGKVTDVQLDEASGNIQSLKLENGQIIEGDLFVDCSGFRALLIGEALGTDYIDWSEWLPCNSAIAVQCEHGGHIPPYTRAHARSAGWQWHIPLQSRMGAGYVYDKDYISDDEALEDLKANISGPLLNEPQNIRFKPGRRAQSWVKNCVSIGLASGFLEPLESTSIHLIQSSVYRLINLFPAGSLNQAEIDQYNEMTREEWEKVRDFIILHYWAGDRDDTPFWKDYRKVEIPESLKQKVEIFKNSGRIFWETTDLFGDTSWFSVMVGQGLFPQNPDPVAHRASENELDQIYGNVSRVLKQAAQSMPRHIDYIQSLKSSSGQTISDRSVQTAPKQGPGNLVS